MKLVRTIMNMLPGALLLSLSCALLPARANAQTPAKTLHIAAAADLQPVMPALAAAYEQQTATKLVVSFGSSSGLAQQILHGAPMDVFLGADFSFPEQVVAAGLADEKQPVPYAQGTLVLWARKDSPAQPLSLDTLTSPKIQRIAIADEFHAPYGRAAYAALTQLKLLDALRPKLVTAENIAQTAQFAETGNAQAAFISLTIANSQHMKDVGTFVYVPMLYPRILQCGVVIKTAKDHAEAHRFLDWLTSPNVQDHLKDLGLEAANH